MTTQAAAVAETHAAVVVFLGDRAYKLRKPVDLGFLDYTTRAARLDAATREVDLNRRLAPDVYLGIADVHDTDGALADHLVVMRRMPVDRRLSTLVTDGAAKVEAEVRRIARVVADFHARAERSDAADECAGRDALARRWRDNTREMTSLVGSVLDREAVEAVDALAARYLAGRGPLIAGRVAEGRAVDGHGDLLADDIFCLDDGPRILDCLEFDDQLRYEDVLADVAFLAMDLERLGRPDLGALFLEAYRDAAGDSWPVAHAHHHIAYRAQVRAKIAAIRASQGDEQSQTAARHLLDLCRTHLDAARIRLVLVGGLPGTGKSTLAAGLGASLGAVVLRSDVVRKELLGVPVDASVAASFGEGAYAPDVTRRVYDELRRRAAEHVGLGASVVLDASWTDAHERDLARLVAREGHADLRELSCVVPQEVAAARIHARAARGGDASDADEAVAAQMAATADAWPEATEVSTLGTPDAVLAGVLDRL
ncbi:bifunctional aminoglycoside phosphotransferase/ATP-binding protein [Actinomarinicola tropica]|uniref:AAA family ATPase n=1 Tax=Actinomarinicola tropica TaxID=2789776 RepID=A0A5Q2RD97_9ACTN|nr:AAA family ATPase [Actinomarinicola tropica]QGG93684.1 AAA family ATPase [Actinomarinicola tropica]